MEPIEMVLDRIEARPSGPSQWEAYCPVHGDGRESLSIGEGGDGRVLINCHAGCQTEDVLSSVGLRVRDLFPRNGSAKAGPPRHTPSHSGNGAGSGKAALPPPPPLKRPTPPPKPTKPLKPGALDEAVEKAAGRLDGREAGRWEYQYADGSTAFHILRFETPGGKEYRPFTLKGGGWAAAGLKSDRPLYRLPELAEASRVYVFEGEKCVELARSLGLTATTTANGAKAADKSDWTPLAGKEVVIVPDHDPAGDGYAGAIGGLLMGLSPRPAVKLLPLPEVKHRGDDLEQFLERRRKSGTGDDGIAAELSRLADKSEAIDAAEYEEGPVLVNLADVEPEEVEWLWAGRIPLGKLTMIAGDPGLGKSFTTLDMAARVSTGSAWPDSPSSPIERGGVLVMNVEDDNADTVVPRLKAAGADLSRINAFNSVREPKPGKTGERMFNLEADLHPLEEAIRRTPGLRLVIIDPISAFMGGTDSHNNTEVRGLLAPLANLAARYRLAVVCVSHLNKNGNGSPIYRTIGSIAQVAAARAAYGVVRDKNDPERCLFLPLKNNLAPDKQGLAYRIGDSDTPRIARVEWESVPVDTSAEEAFAPDRPGPKPTDREEAEAWLRNAMANGPRPAKDVEEEAVNGEGFSVATLRRARKAAGVEAHRPENPGPWWWRLKAGAHAHPAPCAK